MKPMEGFDLAAIAEKAHRESVEEQELKLRKKIAILIGNGHAAQGSVKDLERQLAKAKERLAKDQAKLEAIKNGDWSVLQDDQEKKEQQEKEKGNAQQEQ